MKPHPPPVENHFVLVSVFTLLIDCVQVKTRTLTSHLKKTDNFIDFFILDQEKITYCSRNSMILSTLLSLNYVCVHRLDWASPGSLHFLGRTFNVSCCDETRTSPICFESIWTKTRSHTAHQVRQSASREHCSDSLTSACWMNTLTERLGE